LTLVSLTCRSRQTSLTVSFFASTAGMTVRFRAGVNRDRSHRLSHVLTHVPDTAIAAAMLSLGQQA
jgi:hypothetical protein